MTFVHTRVPGVRRQTSTVNRSKYGAIMSETRTSVMSVQRRVVD